MNSDAKLEMVQNELADLEDVLKKQKEEIFKLVQIIDNLPGDIYWKDKDGVWQGLNSTASENLRKMGFPYEKSHVIGKTDYDLFSHEMADTFRKHDLEVMSTEEVLTREEAGVLPSGEIITQLSTKRRLLDQSGSVSGVIGNTVNISYLKKIEDDLRLAQTAAAEAEKLRLENEMNKNLAKLAGQVVHDIRSPLTSLIFLVRTCTELPEEKRSALKEVTESIEDIANNLLNEYKVHDSDSDEQSIQQAACTLVSVSLLEGLSHKQYEYQNRGVIFDHHIEKEAYFSFIAVSSSDLKRMISNLINNACEACEAGATPRIHVNLEATKRHVRMTIRDNGKGMPQTVIDQVMRGHAVSVDKKSGHGIGLTQVRETLQRHGARMLIDAVIGEGTTFTLIFPRLAAPAWIADGIVLHRDETVVIVDDDKSIHGAWAARFESVLAIAPNVQLKHFTVGQEAIRFINALSVDEKKHTFLLIDYELLNQPVSGLDIISQTNLERSILVTSHYAEKPLQDRAVVMGVKVLPKQLAPEVSILLYPSEQEVSPSVGAEGVSSVDIVMIDDDASFSKSLKLTIFRDYKVDAYESPEDFLKKVSQYSKDTKIIMDYNFVGFMSGVDLAKKLHAQGYQNLYLLSGQYFRKGELPDYLNILPKDDIDQLDNFMPKSKKDL